jgi:hypothetical protein
MANKKSEILFLEEWVVIDYLRQIDDYKKNSKYIELLIGLSLIKFCERQWNAKCWIGIEIKNKYLNELPANGLANFKQLNEIIINRANEDTPVDVSIAKMPEIKNGISRGMHFQIKRFGVNKNKLDTRSLVEFLNNDCKKYGKCQINLIVLVESPEEIDLQLLQKSIDTDNYPFEKIILAGFSENKYINFYGIWPESSWSRYNLNNFQFEF